MRFVENRIEAFRGLLACALASPRSQRSKRVELLRTAMPALLRFFALLTY